MGIEIERKFLVKNELWRDKGRRELIRQGYLAVTPDVAVRVRRVEARGFITVKGAGADGVRPEYEYPIPAGEADELLAMFCAGSTLSKYRHHIEVDGHVWTVDEFDAPLKGLVMAEIELTRRDADVTLPCWVGKEVTDDRRYLNSSLVKFGIPDA